MNIENEKKWFIYVNDHHEGPFSVNELEGKKKTSSITDESYVWCEGMNDWLMISEVKELTVELKKLENQEFSAKATQAPAQTTFKKAPAKAPVQKESKKKSSKLPLYLVLTVFVILFLTLGTLSGLSRFAPESVHVKIRPALNKLTDKIPALSPLFHLMPSLSDLTDTDQVELEQALHSPPDAGVRITIALSQNDLNRPVFYVSTNLPDQTKFDVLLVGNPETLLNKLQYSGQNSVTTAFGLGKTETFLADGGQLIPKGEYQVIVNESSDQPENVRAALSSLPPVKPAQKLPNQASQVAHFVVTKTYFLGGPRDETYLTRLKQFHEKF